MYTAREGTSGGFIRLATNRPATATSNMWMDKYQPSCKITNFYLLISVHEVHDRVMVVVVMHILGCIHRQHQVVGSQPVSLCVSITEDAGLQHLVITVTNTCNNTPRSVTHTHTNAFCICTSLPISTLSYVTSICWQTCNKPWCTCSCMYRMQHYMHTFA